MNEKDMQHGIDFDGQDISGWIATEKFNGCRAYWDGENLWSRGGIKINIPDSWRSVLPVGVHLDGEIYDGVDGVYRCGSAIKYGRFTSSMQFMVFDCPSFDGDYSDRMDHARQYQRRPLCVVSAVDVIDKWDAERLIKEVKDAKGEGIILRNPNLQYRAGRTSDILKLKDIGLVTKTSRMAASA
jgi:DNA ligase-1